MLNRLSKRDKRGFTLIELMIVIAIIGILAAIAIPQFSAYRERAFIASMKADVNAIRIAEEAYYADNNVYKATEDPATDLKDYGVVGLSEGNSAEVKAVNDITKDYTVTVSSTKTSKKVTFDSTTGKTTTS